MPHTPRIPLWILPILASACFAGMAVWGCSGGGGGTPLPSFTVQTFVANATFPTNIRFAPDGRMFYTEKNTGNVRIVENGSLVAQPFATLSVDTSGEQGLLGLALDPDFANNHFVYVFYSANGVQRIGRFTDVANAGTAFTILVNNLPEGTNHNGGKLVFGQDGKLYATVGESGDPANAQTTTNLAGKVLRFNPDGSIPGDNPIAGNAIYTLGHRNMFGIAVFPGTGTLYISENGPTCDDEINRLTPGGNYGWRPSQPCGDTNPGFIQPIRRYGAIVAPTGIMFYTGAMFPSLQGDMLMASFVDGALRRLTISDSAPGHVVSESVVVSGIGSATDVTSDASGNVYIATSTSILKLVQQ